MTQAAALLARASETYLRCLDMGEPYAQMRQQADEHLLYTGVLQGAAGPMDGEALLSSPGGRHERPAPTWYARMLAARWVHGTLSGAPAVALSRAANFFGDSRLAVEVAREGRAVTSSAAVRLRLWQQEAKGLKDEGRFREAREIYRDAIAFTSAGGWPSDTAHFLMLYAKLCHDYRQRQGWYLAFHQIARDRFQALSVRSALEERWHFIARESYAQALYAHDPEQAEELYSELFAECAEQSEPYLRASAHRLRWRLQWLLHAGDPTAVHEALDAFGQLPALAQLLGNSRARNVRLVQYLTLSRAVLERCGRTIVLDRLRSGEALDHVREAEEGAAVFCDRKTLALARVERAHWEVLSRGAGPGGYQRAREAALEHLERARVAAQGEHEPLPAIYLDVLMQMGERNVELRRWTAAVEHYEEAYREGTRLKGQLEEDERQISELKSGGGSAERMQEFEVLAGDELLSVSDALRIDYRSLLDRLLSTAERLHRLREEQTRAAMRTSRELSLGFRYHGVFQRLREISSVLRGSAPEAIPHIEHLKQELESWRTLDDTVFETVRIELPSALRQVIAGSVSFELHRNRINVVEGEACRIQFDEVILRYILENLVSNVYEAANSVRAPEYDIRFRVFEQDGLVWLGCEDNVGGYEAYAEVVRQVNERSEMRTLRDQDRGRGLRLVRQFIEHVSSIHAPWILCELEGGGKELRIPVARPSHEG